MNQLESGDVERMIGLLGKLKKPLDEFKLRHFPQLLIPRLQQLPANRLIVRQRSSRCRDPYDVALQDIEDRILINLSLMLAS